VLASGSGTILRAILDAGIDVSIVVADRRCTALDVATEADVSVELVERTSFGASFDRDAYTHQIIDALKPYTPELIASAGFGTVLAQPFFDAYDGLIVNTHPALLPSFKGWHPVEDALAYGVKITGCTVHVLTLEYDSGPILAQEAVPVLPSDTKEALHERIKAVERRLYPATIKELLAR
jgi:phosphoribosylglycinamide formyltransferase-1